MKLNLKIATIILGALMSQGLSAQSNTEKKTTPASDVNTGYTYDFDKTMDLITDRITSPNKSNADVQVFLDQPDFPVLAIGKNIDANYKDQLRKWMEKNPNLIINTLKPRKDIVTQY